jgi:threonine dehydrogenase-like Zn-dependent dehydrogenase/sugar phosphate isomerase/epimerase
MKLSWREALPLARAAGFEGLDVDVDPAVPVAEYRDAFAREGLFVGGMGLPVRFRDAEGPYAESLKAFDRIARHAQQVGLTRFATWILPFSDTLTYRESFRFHAQRLRPAAEILAAHGARLGLEFIGPRSCRAGHKYPFAHTMEQMIELCDAVGPNAGLLLDSWHWFTSLGTVEDILGLRPEQVVYVHINDAPAGIPVEAQEDLVRRLPGETGVEDLPAFLDALRRIGYDGPVVPEPFVPELGALPPDECARRVGAALDRVWKRAPAAALPAKMKAVATGRKKAWLVDLPVPRPQGNEVVVKLHAAPICGSNMGAFRGDGEWVNDGHEGAGEVVAVAHSALLKVGDRVALAPLTACGQCELCRRGDVIFCAHRPRVHGNFAQYTRTADLMCQVLPDDVSYVHGSLLGCGLGPAYEALQRVGVRAFDTLVVSGLGPVGLGATALGTFSGARVVALDPEPWRRERALQLGAAAALDPTAADAAEAIRDATGGGVLKAVECSGREVAERLLIDLARVRAAIAFVGENQGTIPVSPSRDFIRKGLTVHGVWHMNVQDAPDLLEFLRRAPAKADLLVSHTFGFDRVQEAFDTFASGKSAKVILLPWE